MQQTFQLGAPTYHQRMQGLQAPLDDLGNLNQALNLNSNMITPKSAMPLVHSQSLNQSLLQQQLHNHDGAAFGVNPKYRGELHQHLRSERRRKSEENELNHQFKDDQTMNEREESIGSQLSSQANFNGRGGSHEGLMIEKPGNDSKKALSRHARMIIG